MTDEPLRATISLRGVVVRPDGRVLVVRRASDGGWELPGGRIGRREGAGDGVCREIAEETGLDVSVDRPVHSLSWRNEDDRGRFAVYYRCRTRDADVSVSPEHTDFEWVRPTVAADRLSEPQGTAVERACESASADG